MELVKNCLEVGDYEKARELVETDWRDKSDYTELFLQYPPKLKCDVCGADKNGELWLLDLRWHNNAPCPNCQILNARKELEENIDKYLGDRGVAKRFRQAKLKDFPAEYQKVAKERQEGLFITGPRGVGKTHFVSAIIRYEILKIPPTQWIRPNTFPVLVSVPEFLFRIKGTFDAGSDESQVKIMDDHSDTPLLVLDDLGAEKPSEWVAETLYLLIDRRYRKCKPTIITSNLTLNELAAKLDDRISSRIAEMCKIFKMNGKDRRIKKEQ
jgi:DNA replication protein DnaC